MIHHMDLILSKVLSDELEDNEAVFLISFVYNDGHGHGNGRQDEAEQHGEVPLIATATAATPFTTCTHGGARSIYRKWLYDPNWFHIFF